MTWLSVQVSQKCSFHRSILFLPSVKTVTEFRAKLSASSLKLLHITAQLHYCRNISEKVKPANALHAGSNVDVRRIKRSRIVLITIF